MTEEERKEYRRKHNRRYRLAHKEKIAANREANREKQAAYREANKDKQVAYMEAKKDGLYTVYYLKEDHYAGMTTNLTYRLYQHKNVYNRHIEDVEVIGRYQTKEGAARVEAALHSMGYLGRHPIYKQQQLTQLI